MCYRYIRNPNFNHNTEHFKEAALLTKSLKKTNKTKQNKKSKEAAKSLCQKMEQTNRSFAKNSKKLFLVHSNTNGKILGIFMDRH